jgi:hypothetical protein
VNLFVVIVVVVVVVCRIIVLGTLLGVVQFDGGPGDVTDGVHPTSANTSSLPTVAPSSDGGEDHSTASVDPPPLRSFVVGCGGGCGVALREGLIGFLATLCVAVVLEGVAAVVSMRGTILNAEPRSSMKYILYTRLGKCRY